MSEMDVSGVTVDVCRGGCAGIWFDRFELNKVDDKDESAGEALLAVECDPNVKVDHAAERTCPRCGDVTMMRHFHSPNREVEIDECGKCGGIWLDGGELAIIRGQYRSEADRRKDAHRFAHELLGKEFSQTTSDETDAFHQVSRAFRFLCPGAHPTRKPPRRGTH
ncbi:MAG: zf-TFIIB domain-containing protein [Planctomycetes bacterium]|nr:zf-TFIIB domain-containing protein [Planctomycetota bacterium]